MTNYKAASLNWEFDEQPFFFVEADSFAQHALWQLTTHSQEEGKAPLVHPRDWRHIPYGFHCTVGPTTHGSFHFARIYDQLVCFYYCSSMKVDWSEMHRFLDLSSIRHCNASNFNKCVAACRNASGE